MRHFPVSAILEPIRASTAIYLIVNVLPIVARTGRVPLLGAICFSGRPTRNGKGGIETPQAADGLAPGTTAAETARSYAGSSVVANGLLASPRRRSLSGAFACGQRRASAHPPPIGRWLPAPARTRRRRRRRLLPPPVGKVGSPSSAATFPECALIPADRRRKRRSRGERNRARTDRRRGREQRSDARAAAQNQPPAGGDRRTAANLSFLSPSWKGHC